MYASIRGTTLYYDVLGDGFPLMLLHGGMGLDHSYFRPWLDPLSEFIRLVFVDQRGQGRSSPVASFDGVGPDDWVADVEALRQHLHLERIALLGHSVGGMIAQAYARSHADRLSGLVLCSTFTVFDYPEELLAGLERKASGHRLEAVRRLFTSGPVDDEDLEALAAQVFPLCLATEIPGLIDQLISRIVFRADAYRHFAATVFATFDSRAWLPSISIPTLVIDGANDVVTPAARAGDRLAALLPNATHVVLEGCGGHFPFVDRPEEFLRAVSGFLTTLPGTRNTALIP